MNQATIEIPRDEGVVQIRRRQNAEGFEIELLPRRSDLWIPRKRCQTKFPLELIQYWADHCSFAWFCEAIARHEDSTSVPGVLRRQLFAYFPAEEFAGKRLLDFGCGSGASTFAVGRMLPRTEVVGVELDPAKVELANEIKNYRELANVHFSCSPAADRLPLNIGTFDFVMLSAVYEHLLPSERECLMPLLWSALKPGGAILINQTPYRYSPIDAHSTGLWFINYLPDSLAHIMARRLGRGNRNVNGSPDWNVHLRGGLRGGTEKGIVLHLTKGLRINARVLQPHQDGLRDRADFWLSGTNPQRYGMVKKSIASLFRLGDQYLGTIPGINLEVVIQKIS